MKIINTYIISSEEVGMRFNAYCEGFIEEFPSKSGVKKAILKGKLRLNGRFSKGDVWMQKGDAITVVDLELKPPKVFKLVLEVLYEDAFMAVVNKPAGVTVSGNQFKTIVNCLPFNLEVSTEKDALPWPLPVHRLDNLTSGVLLIAKTRKARVVLGQLFEDKKIQKTYHALVMGRLEGVGIMDDDIEGKKSKTAFKSVEIVPSLQNDFLSLMELSPFTGRTHQIRIHLATLGFPILGDTLYAEKTLQHKGLFLVATKISFLHPILNDEICIEMPLPSKFKNRMQNEKTRWDRFHTQN
ncbi:MAG: RNA pseudouridine synthase [Flavobacteriaceae bacterium]|nr:MAG: RNA pseudouridine synthase [Flavobacteriaceae bacterium]